MQRVSSLGITYSDNSNNKFIDEYLAGKLPRRIFEENGFDIDIIGKKRIDTSAYRWKRAYEKDGLIGLSDTWKIGPGKPLLKRELSQAEIIERQVSVVEVEEKPAFHLHLLITKKVKTF